MTRLFPCLVLLLCCLAACTSRNVPDKAGYTPVAAPWTCATYLDSGENALTPVLMLDGWAAARTQQVRLGTAGTDALLDHLEAWCPAHREEKLADVILAWRRRHADRGSIHVPSLSRRGAAQARMTREKAVSMRSSNGWLRKARALRRGRWKASGGNTQRGSGHHHSRGMSSPYQGKMPRL